MSVPTVVIFRRDPLSGRTQLHLHDIRVIFKMFPESLYSWETQRIQLFNLNFHQNNSLVQLCTSASNCKCLETFLETTLWEPIQLFRRIIVSDHLKSAVPSMQISVERKRKYQLKPGQESKADSSVRYKNEIKYVHRLIHLSFYFIVSNILNLK